MRKGCSERPGAVKGAPFRRGAAILTLTGDRGTGETYCMPHHLTIDGNSRRLMIAALRYTDTFVKMESTWLFAERKLYVDWLEQRELS